MDFDKELSVIYPWILQIARKYRLSTQDTEDLVGETVYKMLLNRDKFNHVKSLKPWCLTVMQNTFITEYNRKSLIHFVSYNTTIESSSFCSASDLASFNDVIATIHRCSQKTRCMDCLIYYAQGYSYDEISEFLNIPVGTVRSRISHGRKLLYQELKS